MNQTGPATRALARHLLSIEAEGEAYSDAPEAAAISVLAKVRSCLTRLVGLGGFEAILSRALALARADASWLEDVQVQTDTSLDGFREAARRQSPDAAASGCEALIEHLLGLLVTFIGAALTLRLLREMWPEAQFELRSLIGEEAPA